MERYALIGLCSLVFAGCLTTNRLSNEVLTPYDDQLYINYLIYNESNGSKLRLAFPRGDFLLEITALSSLKNDDPLFFVDQEIKALTGKEVEVYISVSEPDYLLDLRVTDIDTGRRFRDVEQVSRSVNSRQQVRFSDINGIPMLYNDVKIGDQVAISHADPSVGSLYVHYFPDTMSVARPPYSKDRYVFNPDEGSSHSFSLENGQAFIPEKEGLFYVRADTSAPGGRFLNCFKEDFPKLATARRLIEATRYITKNEEHRQMTTATDKKAALDKFWLERSGSKDRARVLIRTYYNRIRNANIYFSAFKEGWKTDRGMIYIIFGAPEKAFKSPDSEFWWYDGTSSRPSAEFTFDKINGQFILKRSSDLELPWNAEVFEWRQGVIR